MTVREDWRRRFFEDFEAGDVYEHPLGRTITTTANAWFTLLSQKTAPVLFLFHEHFRQAVRAPDLHAGAGHGPERYGRLPERVR